MAPPAGTALPDGWIENFDAAHGRAYYFNVYTQSSQWERPTATARDERTVTNSSDVNGSSSQPPVPLSSLPKGWVSRLDATYGIEYFFNIETRCSQWERPTMETCQPDAQQGNAAAPQMTPQVTLDSGTRVEILHATESQGCPSVPTDLDRARSCWSKFSPSSPASFAAVDVGTAPNTAVPAKGAHTSDEVGMVVDGSAQSCTTALGQGVETPHHAADATNCGDAIADEMAGFNDHLVENYAENQLSIETADVPAALGEFSDSTAGALLYAHPPHNVP